MDAESSVAIVCLDGSEASLRGLDLALRWSAGLHLTLVLVSVVDLYEAELYDGLYLSRDQVDAMKVSVDQQTLQPALRRCREAGVEALSLVKVGRPLKVILEEIETRRPEVVIAGRTGRGFLERLLEGSVARGLTARSASPVVVVP